MELLTASSPSSSDADDGEDTARLDALLRRLLGADRLVILTGLGTSLGINADDVDAFFEKRPAPSMGDLWDAAKERVGDERWEEVEEEIGWDQEQVENIESFLSRCHMAMTLAPDGGLADVVEACEEEIVKACRFVTADTDLPDHEVFLRRIARRPSRLPRTQLFTTNYDLAFETAASRAGFAVIDGFSHAAPQRFDSGYFDVDFAVRDRDRAASAVEWMPNVVQILKLHGSVDWAEGSDGIRREIDPKKPLLIYPRSTKFETSYQPPFLDLMGRFQAALRLPDTALIVIGSGLGDLHLREPIRAAIKSNVRLSVLLVGPDVLTAKGDHLDEIRHLIEKGDRRLSLLGTTFDEFAAVLPDLMAPTDQEQHDQRFQA